MTKLVEEMHEAITGMKPIQGQYMHSLEQAERTAALAKKYIEKAFIEGYYQLASVSEEEEENIIKTGQTSGEYLTRKWLKENGVV